VIGVDVLRGLGDAAAALLLIELLVVLLILLAIAGGLAFGLHWVRSKTDWAFGKVNTYTGIGVRYIHIATDYAALPVIKVAGFAEAAKATAGAVRVRVQGIRAATRPAELVAARPPELVAARPVAHPPEPEPEGVTPLT